MNFEGNNQNESIEELLKTRYYFEDENWEGLCRRVARTIAAVEKTAELRQEWEEKFFDIIFTKKFLPNSPVLFGAGRQKHTLSACFVIPISDDIESILEAQNRAIMIFKAGGGVGINFSKLRPEGSPISTGGVSSGPVVFLELFDAAGNVIAQGGKRRVAIMAILHCGHPDIIKFIDAKKEPGKLTNMNLSVAITDDFMEAVINNKPWKLIYHNYEEEISAKDLFNLIAQRAWESGEPGVFFLDRANEDNSCPKIAKIKSTNPCAEQPLRPNESCTLGSIDVSKFLNEENKFLVLDYAKTIETAVRFLDNTIDANYFPDAKIDNATKKTRPIGLGIMGFADYLVKSRIKYGAKESISHLEMLLNSLLTAAFTYSRWLGDEKGSFPAFRKSKFNVEGIESLRNSQFLSIAPTGSISKIAGCSSGIEPIFTFATETRITAEGKKLSIPSRWSNLPDDCNYKVSAREISVESHIEMLAKAQKYIDTGISKTINMPESATVEDVKKAIIMAWEKGCKGITVFRDNCARSGIIEEYCAHHPDQKLVKQGKCRNCPVCGWSNKCNVS